MADDQNDDITPSPSPSPDPSFSDIHSHDVVRSEAALLKSFSPESEHFDDGAVSENGFCDVVQDQAVSFEFSNDPVLLKQEAELVTGSTSGVALEEQESEFTVELSSAVLGKREMRVSEVQEFAAANGKNGDVSEERESGVSGTQSCEKIEFSEKMTSENGAILENRELGVSGTKSCEKLDVLGKMSSRNSAVMGKRELGVSGTQISRKCALKIEVIDDTALIDTSQVKDGVPKFFGNSKNDNNKRNVKLEMGEVNQEKRPRRRGGGSGKSKNSGADEKEKDVNLDLNTAQVLENNENENKMKKVYSRRELEAFRYQGVEGQNKKWFEVYCGLGPDVQEEYEGLVDRSHGHNQLQQQKKKRNKGKQHSVLNFYPGFQNQAPRPVFGEESSLNADSEIKKTNPTDPSSGLLPDFDENDCAIEQEYAEDDSDEDYSSIQRPAFYVTGEPDFDSGPPEDGLEYLRRVRWEAAQIPKVKVAKVDRSKLNKEQTAYMPQIPDIPKCPVQLMPLEEWEDAFLADFSELRLALSHYEGSGGNKSSKIQLCSTAHGEESSCNLLESTVLDNLENASVADSFLSVDSSIPESCHNLDNSAADEIDVSQSIESNNSKSNLGEASSSYPTLSMILGMNSVARVSMLRKRISAMVNASNLSSDDCLWLFALCAAVDSPLDADTSAALRSLLRKCASLRAEKTELGEEVVMLNILATISGRYFGQSEN